MVATASFNTHGNSSGVGEPSQQFAGKSYQELASEWTNWLVMELMATNLAFDPDGQSYAKTNRGRFGEPLPHRCR